jgi:anthranilate synthase component 1
VNQVVTTEQEFQALAAAGFNRIPLVLETLADLDTPLSAYLKLANKPWSYLLESVQGGERFGRFSFIGLPAKTRIVAHGHDVKVIREDQIIEQSQQIDPLAFIRTWLSQYKVAPLANFPRFCGGLVGYFGHDCVRYMERRLNQGWKSGGANTPDILLLLSTELIVADNLSGKLRLVVYADPSEAMSYQKAVKRLEQLRDDLRTASAIPPISASIHAESDAVAISEIGQERFEEMVEQAKKYIHDGDAMQVVLSQRMRRPYHAAPLTLYRALRTLNPSPYMFYYDFGDFQVVGASPEILVRLQDGQVTLRPIAGTRPRGKTPEQDQALAEDLLADPKERAEHVMLIDLGRNDVGRISDAGTVKLTENMMIERYSHVMHIVSNVEGTLRKGFDAVDVLKATFPAGTLSGAPKVRALEIIDELEGSRRGVYGGAVGYLGFNGDMDLAIAIRTGVIQNGTLYVQAGAGIVADSVPASEWQETVNKSMAVISAAELACRGLV